MRSHKPVEHRCEVCEKVAADPIFDNDEGIAYCGPCAVSLLGAERDLLCAALERIVRIRQSRQGTGLQAARDIARDALDQRNP